MKIRGSATGVVYDVKQLAIIVPGDAPRMELINADTVGAPSEVANFSLVDLEVDNRKEAIAGLKAERDALCDEIRAKNKVVMEKQKGVTYLEQGIRELRQERGKLRHEVDALRTKARQALATTAKTPQISFLLGNVIWSDGAKIPFEFTDNGDILAQLEDYLVVPLKWVTSEMHAHFRVVARRDRESAAFVQQAKDAEKDIQAVKLRYDETFKAGEPGGEKSCIADQARPAARPAHVVHARHLSCWSCWTVIHQDIVASALVYECAKCHAYNDLRSHLREPKLSR